MYIGRVGIGYSVVGSLHVVRVKFLVARFADGLGNGVAPLYHVVSSRLGDGHNAI